MELTTPIAISPASIILMSLNSKVQISADHDCSADGADSNGSSGVTIEEASPQVNLELSIAPPSQPEDASMKETLNG